MLTALQVVVSVGDCKGIPFSKGAYLALDTVVKNSEVFTKLCDVIHAKSLQCILVYVSGCSLCSVNHILQC